MKDYAGNSKGGNSAEEGKPEKNVEKVVVGEVVVQKKGIGRKFKDLFIEADFRSVVSYVASDVLLPAARNMIVDGVHQGVERMMYGESTVRRRRHGPGAGSRITYNNPINRSYREPSRRTTMEPRSRRSQADFILASREEAELVVERMNDILDKYEVASVADLNDLVGMPTTHVDNKWGWVYLGDVQIRQIREGYLLDLPPAEPIS